LLDVEEAGPENRKLPSKTQQKRHAPHKMTVAPAARTIMTKIMTKKAKKRATLW
jgi:hypothetical protein